MPYIGNVAKGITPMNIYLPDRQSARRELKRLKTIEWDLMQKMIALKDLKDYDSSTWCSIYTERLNHNVRPAIKECLDYLNNSEALVTPIDTPMFDEIYGG